MCVYQRSNLFETRQIGKLVQHLGNILNPLPDFLRGVASHQTQTVTPISNKTQPRQLRTDVIENFTFSQKSGQNYL